MEMKTLHLNLKKKWFDMILSGEKTEEYRDIKLFWFLRLVSSREEIESQVLDEIICDMKDPKRHASYSELMNYFNIEFRQFDTITFSNGYKKNRPQFEIELKKIFISNGYQNWGAVSMENYFVLELGEIISDNR